MPLLNDIGIGFSGDTADEKLNKIIPQINEWGRRITTEKTLRLIKTDTYNFTIDGSFIQTLTIPHGLDFAPILTVYLTEQTITNNGIPVTTTANVPLPTHVQAYIESWPEQVRFACWMYAVVDETNIYVFILNGQGTAFGDRTIKYHLLQETAN